MVKIIKLRKGLNINLDGEASKNKVEVKRGTLFALQPSSFEGMTPRVLVHPGDKVKAGEPLMENKHFPSVKFASPVSGTVKDIVRGDRRRVLEIVLDADEQQEYVDFGTHDVSKMTGQQVKDLLLGAGLFGFINQLPYAISTQPDSEPKAIFVSAFRDMPLSCDFDYELKGDEKNFQTGLSALAKMAKTYLGISAHQMSEQIASVKDVEVVAFDGKCPAGNVGVQVNHISPVNKGEVVWTVDPTTVIFIGRLVNTGKVDLRRTIAVAGSEVQTPAYTEVIVGQQLKTILEGNLKTTEHIRVISGNPLTGTVSCMNGFLGAHSSEVTVIPEGDDNDEMLGWIMPRFNTYSCHHSYFSWLMGKKSYSLDARVKGGERHIIMSGEYDKVLPMDIYGEYLIKAIIAQDIDKMEQLGIYEVSPEDFAVAEFIDSSKLELQRIVREGLNMLRKENE